MQRRRAWGIGAALLLCAATVEAQGVEVGILGGLTVARIEAGNAPLAFPFEASNGASFGVSGSIWITNWLALHAEALSTTRATKVPEVFRFRMQYLEWPVGLRIQSPRAFGGVRPIAFGGIVFASERDCQAWQVGGVPSTGAPATEHPASCDAYRERTSDRAYVGGLGARWERGRARVTLEARRLHGTSDLARPATVEWTWRTTSVLAGVAYAWTPTS